eukprot:3760121-Rhodomonas_salina.1
MPYQARKEVAGRWHLVHARRGCEDLGHARAVRRTGRGQSWGAELGSRVGSRVGEQSWGAELGSR